MAERLRIAVTGLAATYPLGGVFWDYAQYLLGFRRLGHDVLYIEDSGKWCYDPRAETFVMNGAGNAAYFARHVEALDPDLADRWFFRDATGEVYGRPWRDVVAFCRGADLFVHVSASCWMRDEYFAAARVAFIDSDPMYTQASVPDYVPVAAGLPAPSPAAPASAITLAQIRRRVRDAFGAEPVEVQPSRGAAVVISPAEVAMYLAYRLTRAAPEEIGRDLGACGGDRVRLAFDLVHPLALDDNALSRELNRLTGQLRVDILRQHDVFFTFAENIAAPECRVPRGWFDWLPTRQPIVIDRFADVVVPPGNRRHVLTTVASWESAEGGPLVDGVQYGGKHIEFERFVDLPARVSVPLELALSGRPPRERLAHLGWRLADAAAVSRDPWAYRDFLGRSLGEWSVAKHAYVASRSGWFSCRTACYLALGVPAVVQDTGFAGTIPVGEGLFAFSTLEEAAAQIECLAADPRRHARAARSVAAEYFDANRVLGELIERAMTAERRKDFPDA